MRSAAIALVLSGTAHADDAIHRKVDASFDASPLELDPALRLDPVEGLATTTTEVHEHTFQIGPRSRVAVEGRVWTDGSALAGEDSDLAHAGWTASARYDVELPWGIHLEVDASLMKLAPAMNGMFNNGTVASYGVALTKYLHWRGGRVAWISLGVEHTELVGAHAPTPAVPQGTTVGVRVGTTF